MLDPDGIVLAHPDASKILELDVSQYDFGKQILERGSGELDYTFEGVFKTANFRRLDGNGWTIVAAVPHSELSATVHTVAWNIGLLGFLMVAATGGTIWLIAGGASRRITRVVAELEASSDELTSASDQLSRSSEAVAHAASEQAASIQEVTESAQQMDEVTESSAANARSGAELLGRTDVAIGETSRVLEETLASMEKISTASDSIGRIIKVVDEIAFQTNILALNAAVEAARAGEAGMGFAVVADEVRNLAQRSAQAAKDTASLIDNSISSSKEGKANLEHLARAIASITESAGRVKAVVAEIESATTTQARGMGQVSDAMRQMSSVTKETAANAEESASAGAELNSQAGGLLKAVRELRGVVHGSAAR